MKWETLTLQIALCSVCQISWAFSKYIYHFYVYYDEVGCQIILSYFYRVEGRAS